MFASVIFPAEMNVDNDNGDIDGGDIDERRKTGQKNALIENQFVEAWHMLLASYLVTL